MPVTLETGEQHSPSLSQRLQQSLKAFSSLVDDVFETLSDVAQEKLSTKKVPETSAFIAPEDSAIINQAIQQTYVNKWAELFYNGKHLHNCHEKNGSYHALSVSYNSETEKPSIELSLYDRKNPAITYDIDLLPVIEKTIKDKKLAITLDDYIANLEQDHVTLYDLRPEKNPLEPYARLVEALEHLHVDLHGKTKRDRKETVNALQQSGIDPEKTLVQYQESQRVAHPVIAASRTPQGTLPLDTQNVLRTAFAVMGSSHESNAVLSQALRQQFASEIAQYNHGAKALEAASMASGYGLLPIIDLAPKRANTPASAPEKLRVQAISTEKTRSMV